MSSIVVNVRPLGNGVYTHRHAVLVALHIVCNSHDYNTCYRHLFKPYARKVGPGCNVVWLLMSVVGVGSFYFHATLSFAGQLVDELAIGWAQLAGLDAGQLASLWPKQVRYTA